LLLPGTHTIGHTLVEIGRTYHSFYPAKSHPLPYIITHTGEGEGDFAASQFSDGFQQCVAGAGVDEVY